MALKDTIVNTGAELLGLLSQEQAHHNPVKKVTPGMPELLRSVAAQGAVLLEACAVDGEDGRYPYVLTGTPLRFDWRETVRSVVSERDAGVPTGVIAAKFMNTLIKMACEMCAAAREKSGLNRVVLSGGSFQNMYIMERLPDALRRWDFEVYTHRRVSPNDEGLSLGQLMVADAILREKG